MDGTCKKMKLGKYKHFKGTIVEVIGIALHSETQEEMIVYNHPDPVKGESANTMWVRPKAMFLENVKKENYAGPRFIKIDN
jgi:hypothetical protein